MEDEISGVLPLDKPSGMTSHDVVARVRRILGTRRVGHAGTLDPMAEGLMLVCVGSATRVVQFLVGLPKDYTGRIRLGAISSTYDAEGTIVDQNRPLPDRRAVEEAMRRQIGSVVQLPPPYSAIKVAGKKLYEYARRGEEVPLKPRRVRIHAFDLYDFAPPDLAFHARVGSGTYIRSMAHDLGLDLGCGAYLASLRRETIGQFHLSQAAKLAELEANPALFDFKRLDLVEALGHLPKITVGAGIARAVLNGRAFTTRDILHCESIPRPSEESLVLAADGAVLSVARGEPIAGEAGDDGIEPLAFRPVRVLGRDVP